MVKKSPVRRQIRSPRSAFRENKNRSLRVLRKCLSELQALYVEATTILRDLLVNPSAEITHGLCARFRVLQEYFALRYQETRRLAISVLGSVKASLLFP